MMKRRSQAKILYDILRAIVASGEKPIFTRILYSSNLSTNLLKEYLSYLVYNGLIEKVDDDRKVYYRITEKGRQMLLEFLKINRIAKAFGIPL